MKTKSIIISLLFIWFTAGSVMAQKRRLHTTPAEMSVAAKEKAEGDKYYDLQGGAFKTALEHYLRAYVTDSYDPQLNYKIGICYLSTINRIQAIPYFQKALKFKPNISRDIHLLLGLSYQLNLQWDEAIKEYKQYVPSKVNDKDLPTDALKEVAEQIQKKIQECKTGKEMAAHPVNVRVENLGSPINSSFAEYGPVVTADESVLYYTARRDNSTGGGLDEDDLEFFEDVYYSEKKDGIWSAPKNMGPAINTELHDATAGISPDGQRLFIYRGVVNGGDLFECRLIGDHWSEPVNLGKPINSQYHESTVCLSYDEKTLYFVSDNPKGSLGGRDIFKCSLKPDGKWGKPENLGPTINTEYDEDGIFMLPDGKTIYFSSQGHNTMGGYDIFKSVWNETTQKWSKPENLGYPINTPDDDVYLALSADGKHGYFSAVKNGGKGEKDLYMVTFLGTEIPPVLASVSKDASDNNLIRDHSGVSESSQLTMFKGTVTDSKTGSAIEATIEISDNMKNSGIGVFKSNSKTGNFLVSLPSGKNYGIMVKADGYLFHSENFDLPVSQEFKEVDKEIRLNKLEAGSQMVLNNIFFDQDKSSLKKESFTELANILHLMKANPSMKIQLSGHTNDYGTVAYNQNLSEERALVVKEYLVKQGIESSRIVCKGYGGTMPLVSNETSEGKRVNRRTEFKILSN